MMRRILFFIFLPVFAFAANLGDTRNFDIPRSVSGQISSVPATLKAISFYRPGMNVNIWVEQSAFESTVKNGMNAGLISDLQQDRLAVLEEFASYVARELLPAFEGSYFSLREVLGSPSPGLNILMMDIEDNFSKTVVSGKSGSFVSCYFDSRDQNPGSGLNGMNLIYMDINPGTLSLPTDERIRRQRSYFEFVRVLSRMMQYQQDSTESNWIREGISQFMIYRFLYQSVFPNTTSRILDAPKNTVPEVREYLNLLSSMQIEYAQSDADMDRVYVYQSPSDPRDNQNSPYFRGFSYLFFSWLFHQAGGNFQKKVTDGDRFFQDLMKEQEDGMSALDKVLSSKGLGTTVSLYERFVMSLFLRTTELFYAIDSYQLPQLSLERYDLLQATYDPRTYRVPAWGVRILRVVNPSLNEQREILFSAPGYGNTKAYILKNTYLDYFHVETKIDALNPRESMLYGDEKIILMMNLDSQPKDFTTRMIPTALTQTPLPFDINSKVSFGSQTRVMTISPSQLPGFDTTGSLILNLKSPGVYEAWIENTTDGLLSFSLEKSAVTTLILYDLYQESGILSSISTLGVQTSQRLVLLNPRTKAKLLLINENEGEVSFSLNYNQINKNLFSSVPSDSQPVSSGLSPQELERISGGGAGGCFVATASFGSLNHPFVRILCRFRDELLLKFSWGKVFVNFYYRYSPPLARWIESRIILRIFAQVLLLPLVVLAFLILNPLSIIFILVLLANRRGGMR